jgi:hypothetical protein
VASMASTVEGASGEAAGGGNSVRFVLAGLPLSMNDIYEIIYSQRRVRLKAEALRWKMEAKRRMPGFTIAPDSFIRVDKVFHYPFYHANGRLRKVDAANWIKLLNDAVAERIGVDDSRMKSGSYDSVDSPVERVEVRLTEVPVTSGDGTLRVTRGGGR